MENNKPSSAKYSITFGLVNGSFGIILGLMLYSLDMHYQNDPIVQIIASVVGILIKCTPFENSDTTLAINPRPKPSFPIDGLCVDIFTNRYQS